MMSEAQIVALADRMAKMARKERRVPWVPFNVDEVRRLPGGPDYKHGMRGYPFPNFGSYRPRGWKMRGTLFCDKTGMGREDEPALTIHQLNCRLEQDTAACLGYGYAIVEEGEFQIVVGVFERV